MAALTINPNKWSIDLNNDGRLDEITWKKGKEGDHVTPVLNTPHGKSRFTTEPGGLHLSSGWSYVYTNKQHTNVRFHATQGLASFAPGQEASYYTRTGTFMTMHIDGLAFGTLSAITNPAIPNVHAPARDDSGKVLNFAYELLASGEQTAGRQLNINELSWVIRVDGQPERLDPNRVVHIGKETQKLTDAEKLIQPLLTEASKLKKKSGGFSKSAKHVVTMKLEKIAAQWMVAHPQSDARVQQLTKPILWNGILGAMAKLAGLTPADFPG